MTEQGAMPHGSGYEEAMRLLSTLISHYTAVISQEMAKPTQSTEIIHHARHSREELWQLRDALEPQDNQQIDSVIAQYGPLVRELGH
ncbi:hypothetical protein [Vogesella sp. LIG4]|uniref:hypothetical protein n=1 Tax=Vogesella sp. LIG4 TaxID=1192162 RepID=UPI00081FE853|nr:hypothetical protein [Vogesella sp. LIG4]SCK09561.1 hypothetical protein PSELUDRAFT_0652 [Vogesella sp. LIG4]